MTLEELQKINNALVLENKALANRLKTVESTCAKLELQYDRLEGLVNAIINPGQSNQTAPVTYKTLFNEDSNRIINKAIRDATRHVTMWDTDLIFTDTFNKEITKNMLIRIGTYIDKDIENDALKMPNHPKAEDIMYTEIRVKLNKKYSDIKKNGSNGSDVKKEHAKRRRRLERQRRAFKWRNEKMDELLEKIKVAEDERRQAIINESSEMDNDEVEAKVLEYENEEDKLLKDCGLALVSYELMSDYETDDDHVDSVVRKQPDYRSRKLNMVMNRLHEEVIRNRKPNNAGREFLRYAETISVRKNLPKNKNGDTFELKEWMLASLDEINVFPPDLAPKLQEIIGRNRSEQRQ